MNTTPFENNIASMERGSRLVLAASLIGAVLVAPAAVPAWLALVALYPAFTALIAWDPLYQVFSPAAHPVTAAQLAPLPIRASVRR